MLRPASINNIDGGSNVVDVSVVNELSDVDQIRFFGKTSNGSSSNSSSDVNVIPTSDVVGFKVVDSDVVGSSKSDVSVVNELSDVDQIRFFGMTNSSFANSDVEIVKGVLIDSNSVVINELIDAVIDVYKNDFDINGNLIIDNNIGKSGFDDKN
jgi:hypothetical protein